MTRSKNVEVNFSITEVILGIKENTFEVLASPESFSGFSVGSLCLSTLRILG